MAKYKVLSTKKLELSLVEHAKEYDIEIIERDFIFIKPMGNREIISTMRDFAKKKEIYAAFTSANAVHVFNNYVIANSSYSFNDWKIFCLSGKTKQAIQNTGVPEKKIIGEARTASGLAQEIIHLRVDEVIFFCGNKRRDELPAILKSANIRVHEVVLYETLERPTILTEDFDAILFFSPSEVQSFFSVNKLTNYTTCFAIGATTAASVAKFTDHEVVTGPEPSPKMIVEKVIQHFTQKSAAN